jgi:hypothetical protein
MWMTKDRKQKLLQAASCLLCAIVAWRYPSLLEGTEFSGGRVTGPVLGLFDSGTCLFVLALFLTFVVRRVAAAMALTASLLCLPLYLYFTAPGPFRRVFRGEYSVPLQASFVWDGRTIAGMLAIAILVYVCLRSFSAIDREFVPERQ